MADEDVTAAAPEEGTGQDAAEDAAAVPAEKPTDYYSEYQKQGIDLKQVKPDHMRQAYEIARLMGSTPPRQFFADVGRHMLSEMLENDEGYRKHFVEKYLVQRPWMAQYLKQQVQEAEEEGEIDPEEKARLNRIIRETKKMIERDYGPVIGQMRENLTRYERQQREAQLDTIESNWKSWFPQACDKLSIPATQGVRRRIYRDVLEGIGKDQLDGSSPETFAQAVKSAWEAYQKDNSEWVGPQMKSQKFMKPGAHVPRAVKVEKPESLQDLIQEYTSRLKAGNEEET